MKTIRLLFLPFLLLICFFAKAQVHTTELSLPAGLQTLIEAHPNDQQLQEFLSICEIKNTEESALQKDELTWLLDSTYRHDWENEDWLLDNRYTVLTRDPYGNRLTASQDLHDANVFSKRSRYEYTYHNANTIKDYKSFTWDSVLEEWMPAITFEYNEAGDWTYSEYKVWSTVSNEYTFGIKFEAMRDANGFLLEELDSEWDLDNDTWNPTNKYTFTPDDNGYVETAVYQIMDTDLNMFVNTDSIFYENTDEGNVEVFSRFSWFVDLEEWEPSIQITYSYNTNDDVDTVLDEVWDEIGNVWVLSSKDTLSYNENHQIVERLSVDWDEDINEWLNSDKYTYDYDMNWNPLNMSTWDWDEDSDEWVLRVERIFTFDMYDNNISYVYRFIDDFTGDVLFADSLHYFYSEVDVMVNNMAPETQLLNISPNPSSGVFTLRYTREDNGFSYRLVDVTGKEVLKQKYFGTSQELNLTDSPKGMYFLVLSTGEVHKLIRQ